MVHYRQEAISINQPHKHNHQDENAKICIHKMESENFITSVENGEKIVLNSFQVFHLMCSGKPTTYETPNLKI